MSQEGQAYILNTTSAHEDHKFPWGGVIIYAYEEYYYQYKADQLSDIYQVKEQGSFVVPHLEVFVLSES